MNPILRRSSLALLGLLLPVLAAAQAGKLVIPDFSDLAKKATEAVDITLDGDMLKSASHMLGGQGRGGLDPAVPGVVSGLKAITVRSFTFDKPDMYSTADVDHILEQVNVPGWKKVISVRDKRERVEIHMRENTEDGGLLIVTEEPRELTIVNIAGRINMDQLRQLQGHMGVPNLQDIMGAGEPVRPALPALPPLPPNPPPAITSPAPAAPAARLSTPDTGSAH